MNEATDNLQAKQPGLWVFLTYSDGRANLREMWLVSFAFYWLAYALDIASWSLADAIGSEWVGDTLVLVTGLPILYCWLMVAFKRLQDCGHSWIWLIVPLLNVLILFLTPGNKGPNKYGEREYFFKWGKALTSRSMRSLCSLGRPACGGPPLTLNVGQLKTLRSFWRDGGR